jgi:hypothetical protein
MKRMPSGDTAWETLARKSLLEAVLLLLFGFSAIAQVKITLLTVM